MNLSPNFSLAELTKSQTATRRNINNTPDADEIAALKALAENILQPLRDHFGVPVIVSSGFRSDALNKRIGGSASSQHCRGEAADLTVAGVSNKEVCEWIRDNLPFDQTIYEFGESGWVHVSYSARHRRELLSAVKVGRRTVYRKGLV